MNISILKRDIKDLFDEYKVKKKIMNISEDFLLRLFISLYYD